MSPTFFQRIDAVVVHRAEPQLFLGVAVGARLRAGVIVEAPRVLGVDAVGRELDLGEAGEPGALAQQIGIDGQLGGSSTTPPTFASALSLRPGDVVLVTIVPEYVYFWTTSR